MRLFNTNAAIPADQTLLFLEVSSSQMGRDDAEATLRISPCSIRLDRCVYPRKMSGAPSFPLIGVLSAGSFRR